MMDMSNINLHAISNRANAVWEARGKRWRKEYEQTKTDTLLHR
jgi:hypothetical protein